MSNALQHSEHMNRRSGLCSCSVQHETLFAVFLWKVTHHGEFAFDQIMKKGGHTFKVYHTMN